MDILCEKSLTKTDLEHQFIVPIDFLNQPAVRDENGELKENITSFDRDGQEWRFRLAIRKNGHPKPTLTPASWHPFVKHFGLQEGDVVKFYIIRNEGARNIRIQAWRKITILGTLVLAELGKV
ncbi:hypothetical protein JCGZ_00199 [Jatropha curcas]|uniref:TF-B3 domain-containing protein n=1 Tax=Jatropha curcas TaxID=180498 RepID=A0A067L1V4_JATCU|nr:hypothetical protein JCGZ_00199 [Jatropha curcas]